MAKELSQAEVLDFLCQGGGRVTNAALLGHFKRFLRDPDASPEQLQRHRELFKGFVNSLAKVKQEAPGGTKYVVLKQRYLELVGEEPKPPAAPDASQRRAPTTPLGTQRCRAQQGQAGSERASRAHGGDCRGERPRNREEEERRASLACGGSAQGLGAGRGPRRCSPAQPAGGRSAAARPPSSAALERPSARCAPLGGERRSRSDASQPLCGDPLLLLRGEAPQSYSGRLPVGKMYAASPGACDAHQRVWEWVERAHAATHRPSGESFWGPAGPSPANWAPSACPPPPESRLGQPPEARVWQGHVPVFRSIRCQLSLQDLEDFVEQESPASEDSSSASGGSDSCRLEAEQRGPPGRQNGHSTNSGWHTWMRAEERCCKPQANGLLVLPPAKEGATTTTMPEGFPVLSPDSRASSSSDELLDKDSMRATRQLPRLRKVARLPPPNLDALLSLQPAPKPGCLADLPEGEGLGLDPDGAAEHRSSLVPLESREHTWLVTVATGSWLQAHALFLEDPHLATRKDFISGYTVLHWLAKHGNARVLQDFVAGARKAGVALDVNAKSGCGYTPLHLAAMHGHQLVIKLLVQMLQCRIQVRDSSGKRPWQYLSSATSGEVWQLLGAPKGKTIFPAHPIARTSSTPARNSKSPQLARKISRKGSLAAYLKPQHIKWKMAHKYPALPEREEYSD